MTALMPPRSTEPVTNAVNRPPITMSERTKSVQIKEDFPEISSFG